MVYDAIMGVGRTNKITEDVITNPFMLSTGNAQEGMAFYKKNTDLYTLDSDTGNPKDFLNPDFDSTTNYAYRHTHQSVFPNAGLSMDFIYDFGKVVFTDSIEYKLTYKNTATYGGGSGFTVYIILEGESGNEEIIDSLFISTGGTYTFSKYLGFKKLRKFIYRIAFNGTSGTIESDFYYLKINLSPLQR